MNRQLIVDLRDLAERAGWTFLQTFGAALIAWWVASGADFTSALHTGGWARALSSLGTAAGAGALSAAKTTAKAYRASAGGILAKDEPALAAAVNKVIDEALAAQTPDGPVVPAA